MKRIKVYFPTATWGMNSEEIALLYDKLNSYEKFSVDIVTDMKECDYVIIQDEANEPILSDKKVIFFQKEPNHVRRYAYEGSNLYKSFYHDDGNAWMPQTPWISLTYEELVSMKHFSKSKQISVVDSGRTLMPGHVRRLECIQNILDAVPDIHIYGHLTEGRENIGPFKTSLPGRKKEGAFLDYKYAFCMENGKTPYYFTEKIIDPMLCWSTPIYWGCSNIDKFFPSGSFVEIKELANIGDQVKDIINSGFHDEADNINALAEARELILNKYNIIPMIEQSLISDNLLEGII